MRRIARKKNPPVKKSQFIRNLAILRVAPKKRFGRHTSPIGKVLPYGRMVFLLQI